MEFKVNHTFTNEMKKKHKMIILEIPPMRTKKLLESQNFSIHKKPTKTIEMGKLHKKDTRTETLEAEFRVK